MNKVLTGVVLGAITILGAMILVLWSGLVSIGLPWAKLPEFAAVEVQLELPSDARIVGVEPISLDCRARIHAEIPVEGTREHSVFGQVYRTDTVTLQAIGDVDTCVEGSAAEVIYRPDGSTEIVIPGESIIFVRPRVDAVATAGSVEVTKGTVGRLTDIFPWVDTDVGLTPVAYAYAQTVIGSSSCMEAAYTVTHDLLIEAYTEQFVAAGADPEDLTVRIEGQPDFDTQEEVDLEGIDMTAATDGACLVSDDLAPEVPESP